MAIGAISSFLLSLHLHTFILIDGGAGGTALGLAGFSVVRYSYSHQRYHQ
ncbi:hypothetical protein MUA04_09260 [Enterobacteriaceae bacterium H11S18]|nr:hypothetical protein [Dryocola clanedunensis]MCT4704350.1 hypothetical protein [Dryocola clanedunensis]MCT4710377.1 hypothetical protein [Dryocola clanedunensis]